SAKFSAQSPPWSRKRRPSWASASCCFRLWISQEVTSGGSARSSSCTAASSSASGYTGICSAGRVRQLPGLQSAGRFTGRSVRSLAVMGVLSYCIAAKPIRPRGAAGPSGSAPAAAAVAERSEEEEEPQGHEPEQAPGGHRQPEERPVDGPAVAAAGQHLADDARG